MVTMHACVCQAFHAWSIARVQRLRDRAIQDRVMEQIERIKRQRELMLQNAPHRGDLFYRWKWYVTRPDACTPAALIRWLRL